MCPFLFVFTFFFDMIEDICFWAFLFGFLLLYVTLDTGNSYILIS
jgi:hypothetical protein